MILESLTIPVTDVTSNQISEMLWLMQSHYEGVSEAQFLSDLHEKDWVILLHEGGHLRGFSTQTLFTHPIAVGALNILYSGDTIIQKSHWGSLSLPLAWGRLMNALLEADPERELYWMLTTKGYKTYRFLPVFFRDFFPRPDVNTPTFEQSIINELGKKRFGNRFDSSAGILRAAPGAQKLKEGIAEIDEKRLRDPYIQFFQTMNPGHSLGDELICLARWSGNNLTPYIRRQL